MTGDREAVVGSEIGDPETVAWVGSIKYSIESVGGTLVAGTPVTALFLCWHAGRWHASHKDFFHIGTLATFYSVALILSYLLGRILLVAFSRWHFSGLILLGPECIPCSSCDDTLRASRIVVIVLWICRMVGTLAGSTLATRYV